VAYRAEIEIGVKGLRELRNLRKTVDEVNEQVNLLNDVSRQFNLPLQNIQAYNKSLQKASDSLSKVRLGTEQEIDTIKDYVATLGQANSARERQNRLIDQQIAKQRAAARTISPGETGFTSAEMAPALPPSLRRVGTVSTSWGKALEELQSISQELEQVANAKQGQIKRNWSTFFEQANELAEELSTSRISKEAQIKRNWSVFFEQTNALAAEISTGRTAKQAQLKRNWANFFDQASEISTELQVSAGIKRLNLQKNWNDFFEQAADIAKDLKRSTLKAYDPTSAAPTQRGGLTTMTGAYLRGQPKFGPQSVPGSELQQQQVAAIAAARATERLAVAQKLQQTSSGTVTELNLQLSVLNKMKPALQVITQEFERQLSIQKQGTLLRGEFSPVGGSENLPGSPAFLAARRRRRSDALGSGIIGGAFPLLFGQGLGAAVGGGLGGAGGGLLGGQFGFGLSLVGTQIGTLFDQLITSSTELGKALDPVSGNIDDVADAAGLAGTNTKKLLSSLKGQVSQTLAAELAAQQLAVVIGDDGVNALRELGEASNELSRELSKAFSAIAASIAPIITATVTPISGAIEGRRLISRAPEFAKTDPKIAKLEKQRRAVASVSSRQQAKIEKELISLIREKEAAEQKIADQRLASISDRTREINILELENKLKGTSRDLTDESVSALEERLLRQQSSNKAYEIGVKFANDDVTLAEYINQLKLNRLILDGKLLDLANAVNKAEKQKEEREKREAERAAQKAKRKQKELERALRTTKVLRIEANVAETILGLNKEIIAAKAANNDRELKSLQISKVFSRLDADRAKINAEDLSVTDRQLKLRIADANALDRINQITADFADKERKQNEEKVKALQAVERSISNEIDLINAKLNGNREEVEIIQEIDNLKEGIKNISVEEADAIERQVRALRDRKKLEEAFDISQQTRFAGAGLQAGFVGQAGKAFESKMISGASRQEAANIAQLTQQMELAQLQATALEDAVLGIGNAFATAMTTGVSELIAGTKSAQEVFADFLKNVGDALVQAAAQMIATYIAIGIAKAFAGLGGNPGNSIKNIEIPNVNNLPVTGRATGGPVNRNSSYLVGEQGPELFTPNQAGRISSTSDTRSLLGRSPVGQGAPAMNFTFETTNFGGKEFVDREQLEAAMAVTRRQAANDGASKGMSMTLDKMQHSPSTRRRVGIS
jgi:hypothetical protein